MNLFASVSTGEDPVVFLTAEIHFFSMIIHLIETHFRYLKIDICLFK